MAYTLLHRETPNVTFFTNDHLKIQFAKSPTKDRFRNVQLHINYFALIFAATDQKTATFPTLILKNYLTKGEAEDMGNFIKAKLEENSQENVKWRRNDQSITVTKQGRATRSI